MTIKEFTEENNKLLEKKILLLKQIEPIAIKIANEIKETYRKIENEYLSKGLGKIGGFHWCHDYEYVDISINYDSITIEYMQTKRFNTFRERSSKSQNYYVEKFIIVDDSIFTEEGYNLIIKNLSDEYEDECKKYYKLNEYYKEKEIERLQLELERLQNVK